MPQKIIMDVCHNFQGIESVLTKIAVEHPEVKNIKIAFAISRKKKLEEIIELFNANPKVKEINILSNSHLRLMSADEAQERMSELGCTKLKPLMSPGTFNNVNETLNQILKGLDS
jgi:folylpolyglutamate synthase/dihydropteroate synthase